MAISRIRGEQIKAKSILNEHVADNAAIEEAKLAIDWAQHYRDAMTTKKVVDFIQVNGLAVGGVSEVDFSATIPNTVPHVVSDPLSGEGVIVDAPKNIAPFRDVVTGDPVLDANGKEVVAHVEFDEAGNKFVLRFVDGDGQPFVMPAGQTIDMQYAKRFNLDTVSEMFAANEKFAEGVADATAHLNITQLAKDLYGATFSLDRDGNANLNKSLVEQLADEILARQNADQAIRDDFASTLTGKGASLVAVEDAAGNFTAVTVEGVLAEIAANIKKLKEDLASTDAGKGASLVGVDASKGLNGGTVEAVLEDLNSRLNTQESGGGQEVTDTHSRDAASANGYFAQENFASLEARLVDIESVVDAQEHDKETRVTALETEVQTARKSTALTGEEVVHGTLDERLEATDAQVKANQDEIKAARGTAASLDTRLDRALNEDGTLKNGKSIHDHKKAFFQAVGGETVVQLSAFNVADLPAYQVGDHSLDVFVNGILQNEGLHYAEVADGLSIDFGMGDGTALVAGDIVTIKYEINKAE